MIIVRCLWLIGKHVRDFLLVLIELFSLGITAEELRAIIGSKFRVEGVAPPTIILVRKLC